MTREAAFLVVALLTSPLQSAEPESAMVVACSPSGRCDSMRATEALKLPSDTEFVWVWSSKSAPRRVDPKDILKALSEAKTAKQENSTLHLHPSTPIEGEKRLVIAAPARMWGEVPEPLLPRFTCGDSVSIPVRRGEGWRVRVVSEERTSRWSDLREGRHDIPLLPLDVREIVVLDRKGKPLADAQVSLLRVGSGFDHSEVFARLDTDRFGRLVLPDAAGLQRVGLVVTHLEHAPKWVEGLIEQLPTEIRLIDGVTLTGRVARKEGKATIPVEGARVTLEAWIDGSSAMVAKEALTASDGSFRVASLPAGRASVAIVREPLAAWRDTLDLKADLDLDVVVLEPEGVTILRIQDDAGQPVAQASAKIGAEIHRADTGGRVRLRGLDRNRESKVVLTAKGMLPTEVSLTPPLQSETLAMMERGVTITGSCVTEDGAPVEDGGVTARFGETDRSASLLSGGAFEITVPGEPVDLSFTTTEWPELRLSVDASEPGTTVDIGRVVLRRGIIVRGRILSVNGAPIPLARIWALKPSPQGEIVAWVRGKVAATTSAEDGSFELKGLERAPAILRADAPGFSRLYIDVIPDPVLTTVDVGDLTLREGSRVIVEATQNEGRIAELDLRGAGIAADLLSSPFSGGVATFPHIAAGSYRLRVRTDKTVECEADVRVVEGEDARVACESAPMRVSGRVLVGDRPVRGGSLVWSSGGADLHGMIINRFTPGGLRQQQSYGGPTSSIVVNVEDDGSFTTEELRPGAWSVAFADMDGASTDGAGINIPKQLAFTCTVTYPGGSVRGVVRAPNGRPHGGATIVDLRDDHRTRARDDGTFVLSGIAGGIARLRAESGALRSAVVPVEIKSTEPAGPPVELDLEQVSQSNVTIRVLAASGLPAPGAFVFVATLSHPPAILTTDRDGHAIFQFPEDEASRLRVAAIADGNWFLGDWVPAEDLGESLQVRILNGGSIAIRGADSATNVRLVSSAGWDLLTMLRSLGAGRLSSSMEISGLPAGMYLLEAGGSSRGVTIERDRVTEVDLH